MLLFTILKLKYILTRYIIEQLKIFLLIQLHQISELKNIIKYIKWY